MAQASSARRSRQPARYEIRIRGQLDPSWSDWFDGLDVTPVDNGETLISGTIPDQAALRGILAKVLDLGLSILSVKRIHPPDQS